MAVSRDEARECLLAALRENLGDEEVAEALEANDDDYLLELDSKTAEYLLVAAEDLVGKELPCPADLGPNDYASLGALIDVLLKA